MIGERAEAAIDATGLDGRPVSRYFTFRSKRQSVASFWTKLTVVCDTRSHFFTAATVSRGPSNDSPQFAPAVFQATLAVIPDRLLGDGAFDSEANHRLAREDCGIRSTVIPVNARGHTATPPTKYRGQMHRRFPKQKYKHRWHAESAFSRHKRRLGSVLQARSDSARERECYLRVLTQNLMLLAI